MMEELCSHIMDIVTNSITAKAKHIEVSISEDHKNGILALCIKDDGVGMDSDMAQKVQDPFFSTKTGRKVGLGIPLLKGTAETTGASFYLTTELGRGAEICASFSLNHPDLPPIGKLKDTVLVLIVGNSEIDFIFRYKVDEKEFVLDTTVMKDLLGGIPLKNPEVINFLINYLDENL
jgi:hypothetical protein